MSTSAPTNVTFRTFGRRVRTVGPLLTAAVVAMPLLASAVPPSRGAVSEFFDSVPAWVNNEDDECRTGESGVADNSGVAYVDNRLLASGDITPTKLNGAVNRAVAGALGRPGPWVRTIEGIEFPTPLDGQPVRRLYQVDLNAPGGEERHDLLDLSRRIAADPELHDVRVSPDHALVPAGPINAFWPNGEPRPIAGLDPARVTLNSNGDPAGTGIKIASYDTGLARPVDPTELPQVERMRSLDLEAPDPDGDGVAYGPVAGHGLAIAGTLQTVSPGADIMVGRIAHQGLATDTTTVKRIVESMNGVDVDEWPHIIVLAFGSPACLADPADPTAGYVVPVGLEHAVDTLARLADQRPDGLIVVASAGNRGESRPYYPAAFDSVVGVGALDLSIDGDGNPWTAASRTGTIAAFSNRGEWVSAWAPGVELPTTHLDNLRIAAGADLMKGYAAVAGTSFSAPVVAALIASHATHDGQIDVRCAWAEIEAAGASPVPKLGQPVQDGVAVVLDTWDGGTPASTPAAC